ncbi:hypothetical protein [Aquimarina sediminis]|uniref:hypothetical protein n=1 Tax=Aquimarina sediminis TaxID=2070536 RepID=UPI0013E8CF09|nr:hypothetical protein [Aquimarina sediminis]
MKIWKNDKARVYYFMMTYQEGNLGRKTELTVIDMKSTKATEWISFKSFNHYL